MSTIFPILAAIVGLSILVIVHEGGHYLAARAFGIRVTRFSIGLGPPLARYQPKGSPTVFQVCAIPFLAYVLIAGMNPAEEVDPDDPELYPNKSLFARMITIFAGPFANYAAASLMVFGLASFKGLAEQVPTEPMVIASVEEGTPAGDAGLEAGDVIVEAEGRKIRDVNDLIEVTKDRGGQPTEYIVERDGERLPPLSISPMQRGERAIIGVTPKVEVHFERLGPAEAAKVSVVFPVRLTMLQLQGMADLVKRRTTEGLTGPVGMGKMVAERAEQGFAEFVWILILISVALGVLNLLPFPALDGGRLAFLAYELITRRRANERIEAYVHTVGLLFLLGVIALVTLRDVAG